MFLGRLKMIKKTKLQELKAKDLAPQWMTEEGFATISKGYLLDGETPRKMYRRVARAAAVGLGEPELEEEFFHVMYYKNWLCPASPVLSNLGTNRGLPISCFGVDTPDSVDGIYKTIHEMAMLTKFGGGVGVSLSRIRGRGELIRGGANGRSEGIVPWAKCFDTAIIATSQGNVRRGAAAVNLDINHRDVDEFLSIRRPQGDVNRQCLNLHQCCVVDDDFMNKVVGGNDEARKKWISLLKTRLETGEPYIMFKDTVNKANPLAYTNNNLEVTMTNICSEITLYTDELHSFICCLSSLNLVRWEEWKDSNLVELTVKFLNGILNEFIDRAKLLPGFERAVRSAMKGRAIGIGVLGWHTLLQQKQLPFDSFESMLLNAQVFKTINERAISESRRLASQYGEPEWCTGTGMFNTHLVAVAPTRSNSIISGDVSPGIEPIIANAYNDKTAKGVFIRKNKELGKVLDKYHKNEDHIWKQILMDNGSVQNLSFLSKSEKEVFLTAYEINQMAIIRQAGQRQKYVDQAQSLNLFFAADVDPKWFNEVHIEAWKAGVKTLYYCRSSSVIKGDFASRGDDCKSCEG
jgi:ribonucleoside-diphosphate reductase alpha chain